MYLPAPVDVATASTRSEDTREREFIGNVVEKQAGKESEAVIGSANLVIASDERGPRNKISLRHFIEQVECSFHAATFSIHIYEMV